MNENGFDYKPSLTLDPVAATQAAPAAPVLSFGDKVSENAEQLAE